MSHLIADKFAAWQAECEARFQQLKANEEELNRIFINIYGLQDELTPEVADKDVTVHRIFNTKDDVPESMKGSNYVRTLQDEIVSLISYAVGCMFGRYSLDVEGLVYAGGEWDSSKYPTFPADENNIIPICDDEYFEDDIVGRFCQVHRSCLRQRHPGGKPQIHRRRPGRQRYAPRCDPQLFPGRLLRRPLQNLPEAAIYWLFDSGKKNGFKALIYMHRYQPDTIARIRTDYVHEQQSRYRTAIDDLESRIAAASTAERVKLNKQLKNCRSRTLSCGPTRKKSTTWQIR